MMSHSYSYRYDLQSISSNFSEYEINTAGYQNLTIALKNNGSGALAGMELIVYAGQDTSMYDAILATSNSDFSINNSTGLIKFTTSTTPTTLASGSDFMMGMDCGFFGKIKFRIKSASTSSVDLLFYLS